MYFELIGELKHIHKLKFWPLHSVLQDKYLISEIEALKLESFLQPMLNLNPDKRSTAKEMLTHEWFEGVVVQGEIEVHLRNEASRESENEKIEQGKRVAIEMGMMDIESTSQGVMNASVVDPLLVHALRPVDPSLSVSHTAPPPPPSTATLPPTRITSSATTSSTTISSPQAKAQLV